MFRLLRTWTIVAVLAFLTFAAFGTGTDWAEPVLGASIGSSSISQANDQSWPNQTVPPGTIPPPMYFPFIASSLINSCPFYLYACNLTGPKSSIGGEYGWAPNKSVVAFYQEVLPVQNTGLYTMTSSGSTPRLVFALEDIVSAVWSPNGNQIAVVANRDQQPLGDLYIYTVSAKELLLISDGTSSDTQPAWSHDGSKLVYVNRVASTNTQDLYTVQSDGSDVTRLTDTSLQETRPTWSPDDSEIAFIAKVSSLDKLFVVEANGDEETNITPAALQSVSEPNWAPNGNSLYIIGEAGGNVDIYRVNADGSGSPTNLSNDDIVEHNLVLSPNGDRLLSVGEDSVEVNNVATPSYDFYVMPNDGSQKTKYINPNGVDNLPLFPKWLPNGSIISYEFAADLYLLRVD